MTKWNKKYLITGGAGFIGSNFLKYVIKKHKNDFFVVLDKLTYAGNLDNIREEIKLDNVSFIEGDICDKDLVDKIFNICDIDYVVNFAAESHVDRSIEDSTEFIRTNVMGVQVLLDVCKKHWYNNKKWKRGKKYLQISTDEVYGSLDIEIPGGELTQEGIITYGYQMFTEIDWIAPRSPYSASKAAADMLVMAYYDTYNMPINITRCSNNYGPYQHPEKLIPMTITNLIQNKNIPVYGKGKNIRDWIYVEDHCIAIDLVLRKGNIGEVYNVGGNNEIYNIDMVKTIMNFCKDKFKTTSKIEFVTDRLGHDLRYAIDSSKIKRELKWEPKMDFEKGMNTTIDFYLNNTQK